jgi:uncharacterized membrane protein YdbT with pleckstrin-like domain
VDLHPGEEVIFDGHPSWRALLAFYIYGTLAAIAVGVIVALAADVGLGVLIGLVVFAGVIVIGFVRRMATSYIVSTQRLYIRRGILSKHVQQTRIDRVQNVNTNQTFLMRILRVGTVDFDTAGTDDSDFTFVGISSPHNVVAAVDRAQREGAVALQQGGVGPTAGGPGVGQPGVGQPGTPGAQPGGAPGAQPGGAPGAQPPGA